MSPPLRFRPDPSGQMLPDSTGEWVPYQAHCQLQVLTETQTAVLQGIHTTLAQYKSYLQQLRALAQVLEREHGIVRQRADRLADALRSFPLTEHHNLCSTATEAERTAFISRVLDWANYVRLPLCDPRYTDLVRPTADPNLN